MAGDILIYVIVVDIGPGLIVYRRELQSKVALLVIDRQADLEWAKEFNRNKIYYSVRDATRREERHFGSLEEVDALSIEVIDAVLTAYQELTTDVLDGQY